MAVTSEAAIVAAYLANLANRHALGKMQRLNDLPWDPEQRDIREPLRGRWSRCAGCWPPATAPCAAGVGRDLGSRPLSDLGLCQGGGRPRAITTARRFIYIRDLNERNGGAGAWVSQRTVQSESEISSCIGP